MGWDRKEEEEEKNNNEMHGTAHVRYVRHNRTRTGTIHQFDIAGSRLAHQPPAHDVRNIIQFYYIYLIIMLRLPIFACAGSK